VSLNARPVSGRIARIDRGAIHDGPGVRTVVFFKGCPLRCSWCHSPETQAFAPDILLNEDRCIACGTCVDACEHHAPQLVDGRVTTDRRKCVRCGKCTDLCPGDGRELVGRRYTVDDVMEEVLKDRTLYDVSGGGVTLSGGEPLMQCDFAIAILARCRRERVHTAVETCGLAPRNSLLEAARLANVVLYDIKLIDGARHRAATHVSNRYILDNLRALASFRRDIVVRFPLVPGVNDDWQNLAATAAFTSAIGLSRVDVLPYHRAGIAKYSRLGKSYSLPDVAPPDAAQMAAAADVLRRAGLEVHAGAV
jgi:pyruvate formate lyase activating enzyme